MIEIFLIQLADRCVQAAIVAALVLVLRLLFDRLQVPKKYICLLWLLPFVCMLIPWRIESRFSLMPQLFAESPKSAHKNDTDLTNDAPDPNDGIFLPSAADGSQNGETVAYPVLPNTDAPFVPAGHADLEASDMDAQRSPEIPSSILPTSANKHTQALWPYLFCFVWGAGFLILFLRSILSYRKLKNRLCGSVPLYGHENVCLADHIGSPFVLGFLRPRIYLPSSMEASAVRPVVEHEQAHIARKDYLFKPLAYLVTSIYWFHPMLWLAYHYWIADMEMACDEAAVLRLGEDLRGKYAETLLALSAKRGRLEGIPLTFSENNIRGRIQNIVKRKRPLMFSVGFAVIVFIALGVICLCGPSKGTAATGTTADRGIDGRPEDGSLAVSGIDGSPEDDSSAVSGIDGSPEDDSSAVSGIDHGPADDDSSGSDISPSDTGAQVQLIASLLDMWYVEAGSASLCRYAITDLDHNGRLEILTAKKNADASYTDYKYWEINETFDGLERLSADSPDGLGPNIWVRPDDTAPLLSAYYDAQTGYYYYVFRVQTGSFRESVLALSLQNGTIQEELLAYKNVAQNGQDLTVSIMNADGTPLTEAQYQTISDTTLGADMTPLTFTVCWQDMRLLKDETADGLTARLQRSQERFRIWDAMESCEWEFIVGSPCDPAESGWNLSGIEDAQEEEVFRNLRGQTPDKTRTFLLGSTEHYTLYGRGDFNSMLLQYGKTYAEIRYPYTSNYMTPLSIVEYDYDGDSSPELAIKFNIFHGTGMSKDSLLIADINDAGELNVYQFLASDFALLLRSYLSSATIDGNIDGFLIAQVDGVQAGEPVPKDHFLNTVSIGDILDISLQNDGMILLKAAIQFYAEEGASAMADYNGSTICAEIRYFGDGIFLLGSHYIEIVPTR